MIDIPFLFYVLTGICAGLLAGLLGLGGGIIVVPALAAILSYFNLIPEVHVMHVAIATSLTTVVITFLASLQAHIRRGSVRWHYVRLLFPGILIGVFIGAVLSAKVSSNYLRFFFCLFLFVMAYRLLTQRRVQSQMPIPQWVVRLAGLIVGFFSSILGVGGGIILMPFLLRTGLEMRAATGTSVACGVVIGLFATLNYIFLNAKVIQLPWSTGFVYWPAFLGVAVGSVLFAPLGTALAYRLPTHLLQKLLAIFLIIVGLNMLKAALL